MVKLTILFLDHLNKSIIWLIDYWDSLFLFTEINSISVQSLFYYSNPLARLFINILFTVWVFASPMIKYLLCQEPLLIIKAKIKTNVI